jgi:hypothetical protein
VRLSEIIWFINQQGRSEQSEYCDTPTNGRNCLSCEVTKLTGHYVTMCCTDDPDDIIDEVVEILSYSTYDQEMSIRSCGELRKAPKGKKVMMWSVELQKWTPIVKIFHMVGARTFILR